MKQFLTMTAIVALCSSPAFALQNVQFDVTVELHLCAIAEDGASCNDTDTSLDRVRDTLVATAPAAHPEAPAVAKTYSLASLYGNDASVNVIVDFSQIKILGPETTMHIQLLPAGADPTLQRAQPNETYVAAVDLSQLTDVACSGPTTFHTMANGTKMAVVPQVVVSNIKILN